MRRSSWIPVLGVSLLLGALLPHPAQALPLAFQGQLTTAADGAVVDDELLMDFRVYDGKAAGAAVLWESLDQSVEVDAGLFVAYLDVEEDLDLQAALAAGKALWLGVTVGQGAELAGRIALAGSLGTVLAEQSRSLVGCGQGGDGVAVGGQCLQLVTEADLAAAVSAHAGDASAHHARFTAAEALSAVNGDVDHWTAAHHPDLATIATSGLATDLVGELAEGNIPEDVVREGDLAAVALSGSAADLSTGTLSPARLPAEAVLVADLQAALARITALESQLDALRNPVVPDTIWVNPGTGDDANDGSQATPKKTLAAAWAMLPPVVNKPVTIQLENGTYPPTVLENRQTAAAVNIDIRGNASNNTSVLFDCASVENSIGLSISNVQGLRVYDLAITKCKSQGILVNRQSSVNLYRILSKENKNGYELAGHSYMTMNTCESDHSTKFGIAGAHFSMLFLSMCNIHDSEDDGIYLTTSTNIYCTGNPASHVTNSGDLGLNFCCGCYSSNCDEAAGAMVVSDSQHDNRSYSCEPHGN